MRVPTRQHTYRYDLTKQKLPHPWAAIEVARCEFRWHQCAQILISIRWQRIAFFFYLNLLCYVPFPQQRNSYGVYCELRAIFIFLRAMRRC